MSDALEIVELFRFQTEPYTCSYIPTETASLEYRHVLAMKTCDYENLLEYGWRRFGRDFFRPACAECTKCRSLRVDAQNFRPSKSQRRTLRRNEDVRFVVQPPTLTDDHLRLYNDYHSDMHERRGWPLREIGPEEYFDSFLEGHWEFSREFLYYRDEQMIGVGLVDVTPDAQSSIYFFHDPDWRDAAPGVFSMLSELQFAQERGARWQYLGYWISECQSMAYKSNYRPHQILESYPADDEQPNWQLADGTVSLSSATG